MSEDFQTLIDEVSALLGSPATLENRDFELIAFGAHGGAGDDAELVMDPVRTRSIMQRRSTAAVRAWFERFGITRATAPLRIPPDPAAGVVKGRICLPARHAGVVYGYVWLLDETERSLEDPRLDDAMDTAARIGALLANQKQAGLRLGELLRSALTSPPHGRDDALASLDDALGMPPGTPFALVAVGPWPEDGGVAVPTAVPNVTALTALPSEPGCDEGPLLAALARLRTAGSVEPAHAAAHRVWDTSGRAARAEAAALPEPFAGVSSPFQGLRGLNSAWDQARRAARAARAETGLGPVAQWADIGPYRLLTALPRHTPVDLAVGRLLAPAQREMARTAEVFLDNAGQAGRTAARLGIHRQTLYYRLSRVEELTGLDLSDGEARLQLHMALKHARL